MAEENGNREIVPRPPVTSFQGQLTRTLRLGPQEELDLSNLDPRQAGVLEAKAIEKAIERDDRRQRLKEDLTVTAAQLGTFTKAISDTAAQHAAVTITNTKDDSLGRTEIIVGNTDAARAGKLSRSQQGLNANAALWVVLSVIAGVVILLAMIIRR
jgi:hypothetical protein